VSETPINTVLGEGYYKKKRLTLKELEVNPPCHHANLKFKGKNESKNLRFISNTKDLKNKRNIAGNKEEK